MLNSKILHPLPLQELASTRASTRERLQEVQEQTEAVERELQKTRRDSEQRLKDAKDENTKLLKDIKLLQDRDEFGVSRGLICIS